MTDQDSSQRQLAIRIVEQASPLERMAIQSWAGQMLDIRSSDFPKTKKIGLALKATLAAKVVWPAVKMAAINTKKIGWDDRSRTARLGLGGAAAGIALFGGANAGVAALGTAIGVPLWVVLGAGASFANFLVEEASRHTPKSTDAAERPD